MACHPVDEKWLSAILSQLDENSCTCDGTTQSVEFKESFNFANLPEYARTMAAFANNSGGYIILGVRNEPREIVGLVNDRFSQIDPARISTELNQVLDPALVWRHGTVDHEQKHLGYLHVREATRKPVVCRRNESSLRESAIYYRYPGETREIRFAELVSLLEQLRLTENNKWISLFSQIATVGIDNSAVLDLESGEVSGPKGTMFIPAELLPRLQFVREGQFVEKIGAPTLKLIGEAQIAPVALTASSRLKETITKVIEIPTQIGATDVIKRFLLLDRVMNPKEFLLVICNQQAKYYPIHFYRRQANLSLDETIRLFENESVRSQGRKELIKRLRNGWSVPRPAVSGMGEPSLIRAEMLKKLQTKTLTEADLTEHLDRLLEAIRHLESGSSDLKYVVDVLLRILPTYGNMSGPKANLFRTAIAYLDETWYGKDDPVQA